MCYFVMHVQEFNILLTNKIEICPNFIRPDVGGNAICRLEYETAGHTMIPQEPSCG